MKKSILMLLIIFTISSVMALSLNIEINGQDIESVDVMNGDQIAVTADASSTVTSAKVEVELLEGDADFFADLMSVVNEAMAKTNYRFTGNRNSYSVEVPESFAVAKNILNFPAKVPDSMDIKLSIEMNSESGDYERELVLKLRKDQLLQDVEDTNSVMGSQFIVAKKIMTVLGGLITNFI